MPEKIKLLGFAGSLRKGSFNRMLLNAAVELMPEDGTLEIYDLSDIPLFNQDSEDPLPKTVADFKERIRAVDGVLIVTPEYNYSMPGVLKNAIDYASRPYGDNPFDGKPGGIMGASVGTLGTARAQYHLRQSAVFLNFHLMNQPEIMVPVAQQKFDDAGRLIDEKTRERVANFLRALVAWTRAMAHATAG